MNQFDFRSQQPGFVTVTTAETQERVRSFFRSVYAWMTGGLVLSALASMWVVVSPAMQQIIYGNRAVLLVLIAVQLGLVFWLSLRLTRMSPATAASAFLVFSLLNGLTLSWIFFAYTQGSIVRAFAISAGMFAGMSIYGTVTKRDLTSWGAFFFMGLIGLIICSFVNIFLNSSALSWTISIIGVFVFLGLTASDTQKLKSYAMASGLRENLAISGALTLYLDFVNLFLFTLRLFGGRRD